MSEDKTANLTINAATKRKMDIYRAYNGLTLKELTDRMWNAFEELEENGKTSNRSRKNGSHAR